MVKYIKGEEREQLVLFPTSLEDMIDENNEIRVIDAFVDSLDIKKLGIKKAEPKMTGRPSYDQKDMLKIYLYGYRNKVRSSRKLMNLCKTNIEMMWLVKQIVPDFRSISDFRKDNGRVLKEVFLEFNIICKDLEILNIKEVSQDGTKIRAVNAKDKNYTLNKIDDRIERLKEKIENYLEEMEENDKKEKSEKLVKIEEIETNKKAYETYQKEKEEKIKELRAKKELYESYKKEMEEAGVNQKSLTDPESKLMKNNGGFNVCYNMQTIVTTDNHLIANYEITDNPADFGSMSSIVEEAEDKIEEKIERNITDNGYSDRKDMIKCLENGTIPEVTPVRGREGFTLETVYEENEISDKERKSKDKEDIKKSLRAGEIPEIYKDKIESIEVKEEKIRFYENAEEVEELEEEQMRDKAMEEGIFIRDIKGNKVYCPGGCILRQKSKHENGIKYCNKLGCKNCKNPCTMAAFKEVKFREGQTVVVPNKKKKEGKKNKKLTKTEKVKKVVIKIKTDKEALKRRMRTSEHNHGSMKRWDDAGYTLLKGKEKVTGEVALYCCAYNIRRAVNILGVKAILEYFEEKKAEKEAKLVYNFRKICDNLFRKIKYGVI